MASPVSNGLSGSKLEKQRSVTEVQSHGMGSKTASLYLSRTTSLIQPGGGAPGGGAPLGRRDGETRGTDKGSQNGEDAVSVAESSPSKKTSVTSLKREFTFTGYDIMADDEPSTPKPTTEEEISERANRKCYLDACKVLGLIPVNYISRHINDKHLVMKSHPLGPVGARAVCIALVNNRSVESIDFEDNDLGTDGAVSVAEMLRENNVITEVKISENLIGSRGAFAFTELLKDGKLLHTLNISGSGLEDSDGKFIADMIEFSSHLKVLNVSHNRLGENASLDIGRAMAINDTLQELDLSWNHIRGIGSIAIAIGLQKNVTLKKLNVSWNGFAKHGAEGLWHALEENRTLRELDVSNNRLGLKAVPLVLKGLMENDGLATLRIGQNPFSPEVAMMILKAIGESEKCVLTTLDISDIVVRTDFITAWDEIKRKRALPLRILFGAVVKSGTEPAKDPNAINWRDPVTRMFKFMHDQGYRVIDLLKKWDKDGSFSVDRHEFKKGFMAENSSLTEAQLDEVMDRLDVDGDGEVDLGELLKAEKEFRRRMHLRLRKLAAKTNSTTDKLDAVLQRVMQND
ncbi:leucine-rich repeat-containing protein 74B-like isoform X1 [Dreissena polymorpha]|nr:leucine-rich repeat-containing protein 74B-like isoform X1 [Dreissena polymorpha]